MSEMKYNMHFVCTREEAQELIKNSKEHWISKCGCRVENQSGCGRSRVDVCLGFTMDVTSLDSGVKKATYEDTVKLIREAEEQHLVCRPYRDMKIKEKVDGICFCCDDCCEYFFDEDEQCDKGNFIEQTNMETCTHCGICVDVCYFNARTMNDGKLEVNNENCYGCGLCFDVCPVDCIQINKR